MSGKLKSIVLKNFKIGERAAKKFKKMYYQHRNTDSPILKSANLNTAKNTKKADNRVVLLSRIGWLNFSDKF